MENIDLEKNIQKPTPAVLPPSPSSNSISTSSPPPSYRSKSIDEELDSNVVAYRALVAKEKAAFRRFIHSYYGWSWILYLILFIYNTFLLITLAVLQGEPDFADRHDYLSEIARRAPVTAFLSMCYAGLVGLSSAFTDTPIRDVDFGHFSLAAILWIA